MGFPNVGRGYSERIYVMKDGIWLEARHLPEEFSGDRGEHVVAEYALVGFVKVAAKVHVTVEDAGRVPVKPIESESIDE